MFRKLYLLRHGKSDWSVPVSDYRRPLSTRGIRESGRLGTWMSAQGIVPQRITSSAAVRARQTTELVTECLHTEPGNIDYDEGLYLADEDTLLALVKSMPPRVKSLMLVGHNPGMEALLVYLAGKALPSAGLLKVLPTATLACLSLQGGWSEAGPDKCTLDFITRGRSV